MRLILVRITARANISLGTIKLLTCWYEVAKYYIAQLQEISNFKPEQTVFYKAL